MSFPVETDDRFYAVVRYVERNALLAAPARRASLWRWGSAWIREQGCAEQRAWLTIWPVSRPRGWDTHLDRAQREAELAAARHSLQRVAPFGAADWVQEAARRFG